MSEEPYIPPMESNNWAMVIPIIIVGLFIIGALFLFDRMMMKGYNTRTNIQNVKNNQRSYNDEITPNDTYTGDGLGSWISKNLGYISSYFTGYEYNTGELDEFIERQGGKSVGKL